MPRDAGLRAAATRQGPTLAHERRLRAQGVWPVAGLDEAGRGSIAGPVTAGAVVLPHDPPDCPEAPIRDSKRLTPAQRERALRHIESVALAVSVGHCYAHEIDEIGIAPATRLAMRRALESLPLEPAYLLLDAFPLPSVATPQLAIVRGDATCTSIAAASIVAKVARDRHMAEQDERHPGYGFARHKGYGTAEHLRNLERLGPSTIHRRTFAPLKPKLALGMETPRQGLGRTGEELARNRLVEEGRAVLAVNCRTRSGEIDIVTEKDGVIAFVEVRAKRGTAFGLPEESLTQRKLARMVRCAHEFLADRGWEQRPWRIDVVAVGDGPIWQAAARGSAGERRGGITPRRWPAPGQASQNTAALAAAYRPMSAAPS